VKIFLVGGAVRDALLELPVGERDWVVVGGDPAQLRQRGFVAADAEFPVFLHPETGEEYALARREVKRGQGYRGFEVYCGPDVTLEEDLLRRDLTVNAIAQDSDGRLVDPYHGRDDLAARQLRHVSPAFVEDPLRVLRVARFAAKLGGLGFQVADATHRLLCSMAERGDLAQVRAERLWREMAKAMQTEQPWRFFEVLHRCGALAQLIPALAAAMAPPTDSGAAPDSSPIAALKRAHQRTDLGVPSGFVPDRVALILAATLAGCVDSVAAADRLLASLRADRATARLLRRVVGVAPLWEGAHRADPDALFEIAHRWRVFDPKADVSAEITVCEAQASASRLGQGLAIALPAARAVTASTLVEQGLSGAELGRALAAARRHAMVEALRAAGLSP